MGIVYAPDYLANGGGALAFGLMAAGETDEDLLRERVEGLGDTMRDVLAEARRNGESPAATMKRRVRERLGGPLNRC